MTSRCAGKLLLILAGLALLAGLGPVPAGAQPPNQDIYAALFPSALDLGRHQFARPPVEVSVTENLPQQFRCQVAVPSADWRRVPPEFGTGGAQRLAGFVSPRGINGGVVEVLTHELKVEVNPVDWLLAVMIKAGATILKTRPGWGAAGRTYEVLALLPKCEDGSARLVRAAVYRSGKRLFVVRCLAREKDFAALTFYFAAATLLFKPQPLAPEELVGNWAPYCLPAGLCFLGPGQGRAKVPWPGRAVQEAGYDLSLNGKITGTLHIKAIQPPELASATCDQRIKILVQSLKKRGVKVKWQGGGVQLHHLALPGKICFFRGKSWHQGNDLELYVFSWRGQQMGALVWMLTVGQVANLPAWMHNKRTFEIVCQSLKTTGVR